MMCSSPQWCSGLYLCLEIHTRSRRLWVRTCLQISFSASNLPASLYRRCAAEVAYDWSFFKLKFDNRFLKSDNQLKTLTGVFIRFPLTVITDELSFGLSPCILLMALSVPCLPLPCLFFFFFEVITDPFIFMPSSSLEVTDSSFDGFPRNYSIHNCQLSDINPFFTLGDGPGTRTRRRSLPNTCVVFNFF